MKSLRPAPPKRICFGFKNFFCPRSDIRRLLFILSFVLILFPALAGAAQVSLSWQRSTGSNIAGYKMHYGNYRGSYQYTVNVGNSTSCTISGLDEGQTYYFAATAYNSAHQDSDYSNEVSYRTPITSPSPPPPTTGSFRWEVKGVLLDHNWKRVVLKNSYTEPIVIANTPSFEAAAPVVVRIRNITSNSFEICLQEWNYQDGVRFISDRVHFIVMERGSYILGNGNRLEAGVFQTDNTINYERVSFEQNYNTIPVVITSVVSNNGSDAVIGRIRNIGLQRFDYRLQEEEAQNQHHTQETIHYITWEPSKGTLDGILFEVSKTGNTVTENFRTINFTQSFPYRPVFVADMQTSDGGDTANLRWRNKTTTKIEVQVDEEQSRDSETVHTSEVVGYMVFAYR